MGGPATTRTQVNSVVRTCIFLSVVYIRNFELAMYIIMTLLLTPPPPPPQTLKVEQLLTTGGGWQDQCGGLYPGAKQSESPRSDQMLVTTRTIGMYVRMYVCLLSYLLYVYHCSHLL